MPHRYVIEPDDPAVKVYDPLEKERQHCPSIPKLCWPEMPLATKVYSSPAVKLVIAGEKVKYGSLKEPPDCEEIKPQSMRAFNLGLA